MSRDIDSYRAALQKRSTELLTLANVVATGVGYKISNGEVTDELSIVCSVVEKKSAGKLPSSELVPQTLDGVQTDVVETGRFKALQNPTGRFRPAPGGVSIGHVDITAGTLGCLVRKNGQFFILSNNHVLANSNAASVGDPILQPGPFDGGLFPRDQIATLDAFIPIQFPGGGGGGGNGGGGGGGGGGGCGGGSCVGGAGSVVNSVAGAFGSKNRLQTVSLESPQALATLSAQQADNLVDCALARPVSSDLVENTIHEIGPIQGSTTAQLGMAIKKSGRTTGFTTGVIQQIDVTVEVSYGAAGVARFTDQLLSGAMSQGGDSGSAVLNSNNEIVGLLFAGSSTSTIMNRIQNVFSALGVTL
jgi:hypothetical protein